MQFAFTEEQEQLRGAARSFLGAHSSAESVRRTMQTERGFDPDVWNQIGSDLGWTALLVPEEYGGLGLGWVELAALLELTGEALLCAPLFSTLALGANALLVAGTDAQKRDWLPAIAEGRSIVTLAWAEGGRHRGTQPLAATARRDGDGFVLSGTKRFVVDGAIADALVVAARPVDRDAASDVLLFLVPAGASGLERRPTPALDPTRRLAQIELRDVRIPATARLAPDADAAAALGTILDRAAIALAAEQTGGAERCLDLATGHAKQRIQFGQPIGSFQAIQHMCADMLVKVESARSASYYAACVAAEGGANLTVAASLAKATCSEAYFACAADCLQVHGGVGFTWEYDVHLHLKRAKAGESFLGSPTWHRERIAQHMGL